jgi:hypothetical protein
MDRNFEIKQLMVVVRTGRRWWIPLSIIAGLVLAVGLVWFIMQPTINTYTNNQLKLSFEYNADDLVIEEVQPSSEEGNIFARISEKEGMTENILITLRTQAGLATAAGATGQSPLVLVSDAILRAYPTQFPEFNEIVERSITIDTLQAFRYEFTYQSPAGETIQQVTYAIGLNSDEVLLINMQTIAGSFEAINQAYFEPIIESIQL